MRRRLRLKRKRWRRGESYFLRMSGYDSVERSATAVRRGYLEPLSLYKISGMLFKSVGLNIRYDKRSFSACVLLDMYYSSLDESIGTP